MLRPEYPILTTRLLLRPLEATDVEAMHSYRAREDVCRYLLIDPQTPQDVAKLIAERARAEMSDEGQALTLAVVERASGELIGDVVLFWISRQHRGGEVGYVLHPKYAGNGYATEAAAVMVRLGFNQLGLHRIAGRIDARNTASARVLEKLGMRREAHFVENEFLKGEWTDEVVYAVRAPEWRDPFS